MDGSHCFVKGAEFCKHFHVGQKALRKWADNGKIQFIRTPGGVRLYDINSFNSQSITTTSESKLSICYSRVSTKSQRDDLQRDIEFMQSKFPTHKNVQDVASGLNFNRRGLKYVLDKAFAGELEEIVVSHRDRLSRIAFPLFEYLFDKLSVRLVVLEKDISIPDSDLVSDLVSLVHSFSAKMHGKRSHSRKNCRTKGTSESSQENQSE